MEITLNPSPLASRNPKKSQLLKRIISEIVIKLHSSAIVKLFTSTTFVITLQSLVKLQFITKSQYQDLMIIEREYHQENQKVYAKHVFLENWYHPLIDLSKAMNKSLLKPSL